MIRNTLTTTLVKLGLVRKENAKVTKISICVNLRNLRETKKTKYRYTLFIFPDEENRI